MSKSSSRSGLFSLIKGSLFVVALLIGAAVIASKLISSPFKTKIVDRSAPPVLNEIHNLAEYHAAQGSFEVLVDIEKDVQNVPSAILGTRVLFMGVGTVDAVVDFTTMSESAVSVSPDGKSVVVVLPRATLTEPAIDYEQSRVLDRDRGLLDRIGGVFSDNPTSEAELYVAAGNKLAEVADQTDLLARAEDNTKLMLYGMLKLGGFDKVDVRFVGAPVFDSAAPAPAEP
jgi:hypothetical protein